ncbi:hypothetical protein EDC01DRAFT_636267 [Geopyxis carbonaria]|nr:hypothetical protein EDC01DRAFT_636267 [Geopyxis carbonaria]
MRKVSFKVTREETEESYRSSQNTDTAPAQNTFNSFNTAHGSFLDPAYAATLPPNPLAAAQPYTIVPAPTADDLDPLHRALFQAVLVAAHVRLRASWGPEFANMHPPAIARWSREKVASAMRAFETSDVVGGQESVLVGLALALLEKPEDEATETVLIGLLGGLRGMNPIIGGDTEDEAGDEEEKEEDTGDEEIEHDDEEGDEDEGAQDSEH